MERRPSRLLWRAIRLRCPNCGGKSIFRTWFRMRLRCGQCGLLLTRGEEGYQVGSYMFNIAASELVVVATFVGVLVFSWPTPPWGVLQVGVPALAVVAPLVFFPFTRTLFLAFHLAFRPPSPDEFS